MRRQGEIINAQFNEIAYFQKAQSGNMCKVDR